MWTQRARPAPIKLLTLFVLVSGVPLGALGWLGWRVLRQDQALERQQARERLDDAASLLEGELERSLAAWETMLPEAARGGSFGLPANAVFLLAGPDGVSEQAGVRLPYYPRVAHPAPPSPGLFAASEALEFRDHDPRAAAAAYRRLSTSSDRAVRAEALMRLARVLRQEHELRDALSAYTDMATLGDATVAGSPAELVALRERVVLFGALNDPAASAREAARLRVALDDGRFRIDQPTFEFFSESAAPGPPSTNIDAARASHTAQAVAAMWPRWLDARSGRTVWTGDAGSFAAVWRTTPAGVAAIAGSVDSLIGSAWAATERLQVRVQLDDETGRRSWGDAGASPPITKSAKETGLPWDIRITPADAEAARTQREARRDLFVAGFMLVTLVIGAAGYVVFRAVSQDLAVARLQSDFVAAVSHEFRTPLTAMCHLTELLEEDAAGPDRLPEYYRALGKESRRLHTMVERLLDFGRMEAGRRIYDLSETDPATLVTDIVQDFRSRTPLAAGRVQATEAAPLAASVRVDRDALALALGNLLDNALKYSPDTSPVRVSVNARGTCVAISVDDEGPGISAGEQRDVFRKFARGAAARAMNVTGTGIGLAMADDIVKAHGGRLELVSEAGRGSTFTIVLPAA